MRSLLNRSAAVLVLAFPLASQAAPLSLVESGQTSVVFGNSALQGIGLEVVGVGGPVIAPGSLGPLSVAFPINARDAGSPLLPTTFSYDSDDFLTGFSGTIEHEGSVTLGVITDPGTTLELGNFTIGFDGTRVSGDATGFFVQDNLATGAILFDVTDPLIEAFEESLVVAGNIAISPELDTLLQDLGLVESSVAGADAGLSLVAAEATLVPVPAAAWLFGSALALLAWVRGRAT